MTKAEWREQQRKLPIEEKLRILEDLRRRDLEIQQSSIARRQRQGAIHHRLASALDDELPRP